MKSLSRVRLFATPWTVAYKAPLSMEFSRQEYWSGLPFPSPGNLPYPGIEPGSPALQADPLPSESPGKESWVPKNWCFWTVVLEKTLESPLDCKEIQPVHPKGNQSWIFIGRTDVVADFDHLIRRTDSLEKTLMLGKIEGGRRKGWQRIKMVGWHHRLNGPEFE